MLICPNICPNMTWFSSAWWTLEWYYRTLLTKATESKKIGLKQSVKLHELRMYTLSKYDLIFICSAKIRMVLSDWHFNYSHRKYKICFENTLRNLPIWESLLDPVNRNGSILLCSTIQGLSQSRSAFPTSYRNVVKIIEHSWHCPGQHSIAVSPAIPLLCRTWQYNYTSSIAQVVNFDSPSECLI